jgi:hypothetical protein
MEVEEEREMFEWLSVSAPALPSEDPLSEGAEGGGVVRCVPVKPP